MAYGNNNGNNYGNNGGGGGGRNYGNNNGGGRSYGGNQNNNQNNHQGGGQGNQGGNNHRNNGGNQGGNNQGGGNNYQGGGNRPHFISEAERQLNNGSFPYANQVEVVGQVAPTQALPDGFNWVSNPGQQPTLQINLKIRRESFPRNSAPVLKLCNLRVVLFRDFAEHMRNNISIGTMLAVRGEYRPFSFPHPKIDGEWVTLPQIVPSDRDQWSVTILGSLDYTQEESTPSGNQNRGNNGNGGNNNGNNGGGQNYGNGNNQGNNQGGNQGRQQGYNNGGQNYGNGGGNGGNNQANAQSGGQGAKQQGGAGPGPDNGADIQEEDIPF